MTGALTDTSCSSISGKRAHFSPQTMVLYKMYPRDLIDWHLTTDIEEYGRRDKSSFRQFVFNLHKQHVAKISSEVSVSLHMQTVDLNEVSAYLTKY